MRIWVGSTNPVKVRASENSLRQLPLLHQIEAEGIAVPSGVSEQPMSEAETRLGAVNRVKALLANSVGEPQDWYIALEGGVDQFADGPATFAYVAIYHQGQWAVGRSASLPLPNHFYQALLEGAELGDVMDRAFNTQNIKQKGGAIGLLTDNHASRQSVYEVTITLALARFRFPELYE